MLYMLGTLYNRLLNFHVHECYSLPANFGDSMHHETVFISEMKRIFPICTSWL